MSDFFVGWHVKDDEVTLRKDGHNFMEFGG